MKIACFMFGEKKGILTYKAHMITSSRDLKGIENISYFQVYKSSKESKSSIMLRSWKINKSKKQHLKEADSGLE